jgi:hypothetical protein
MMDLRCDGLQFGVIKVRCPAFVRFSLGHPNSDKNWRLKPFALNDIVGHQKHRCGMSRWHESYCRLRPSDDPFPFKVLRLDIKSENLYSSDV